MDEPESFPWMAGGGECGALMRSIDWSRTPLGPPATWPSVLRTTISTMLGSRHPMFLFWGPERIQLYNDAYVPSFGHDGRHPTAMGQRAEECWSEIWHVIGPMIDEVMQQARPSWKHDQLVPTARNHHIEEVYWSYEYSPVRDEDGVVGGTLVVSTETTSRVLEHRRLNAFYTLAERATFARDMSALIEAISSDFSRSLLEVPFAILVHVDADGTPKLAGTVRWTGLPVSQNTVHALASRAEGAHAPVQLSAAETRATGLDSGGLETVLVPSAGSPGERQGFICFGVSGRLKAGGAYVDHFVHLANQIGQARTRVELAERRTAVERERDELLLHAPVPMALFLGPEHVFAVANPPYCRMIGRDDVVGKRLFEVFPTTLDTPLPAIFDRAFQSGEPFSTAEMQFKSPSGQDMFFMFNLEPLRDAHRRVYGLMVVAIEITNQVQARRVLERVATERQRLLDQLEQANRAKDDFLAMLSHELRNPLSPILTALQLMQMKNPDINSHERAIIERQVKYVVRLVDDLLDVSRITRGKVELRREKIELGAVITRSIDMVSPLLERKRHKLIASIPRRGLCVDVDPTRFEQIITNLLTNAAKYTDDGGSITVTADEGNGDAVVTVTDTGRGIDPAMLPHVFDLFAQERQPLARSEGGLGIGLAVVKSLVALHGGTASAASEGLGKGSTFTVRVPLAPELAAPAEPASSSAPRPSAQQVTGSLLLVDDNREGVDLLASAFEASGYETRVAYDGPSALQAVQDFHPDVALLDIGLPVMDGFELGRRLKELPEFNALHLVAVTGYGQESDRAQSREAGFELHVVKPVDFSALEKSVRAMIQSEQHP